MSKWHLSFLAMGAFLCMASCSNHESAQVKSVAERKAEEKRERNPVKKGRYQCWRLSSAGDEVTDDLFILTEKIYQVAEDTGRYQFERATNTLQFTSGPFHHSSEPWVGIYTPKGANTGKGGQTEETMIEIRRQSDVDAGNERVIIQCNYAEVE